MRILFILCTLVFAGCAPDLVVTSLQQTGDPVVNSENQVELPVRVTVRNEGNANADRFKVSTHYTQEGSSSELGNVVAFTVPDEGSVWYPDSDAPLAEGAELTFEGIMTFHSSVRDQTVAVRALSDSCSGDEFVPDYCRVKESDEDNNASPAISVVLP